MSNSKIIQNIKPLKAIIDNILQGNDSNSQKKLSLVYLDSIASRVNQDSITQALVYDLRSIINFESVNQAKEDTNKALKVYMQVTSKANYKAKILKKLEKTPEALIIDKFVGYIKERTHILQNYSNNPVSRNQSDFIESLNEIQTVIGKITNIDYPKKRKESYAWEAIEVGSARWAEKFGGTISNSIRGA